MIDHVEMQGESVFIADTTCEDRRIGVRSVDRHLDLTPFSADGKRVTILVREHVVIVPLWIPTLGFVTALWFSSPLSHDGRHRKRKKLGLCLKCGYDLRASKDRCPECGEGVIGDALASAPQRSERHSGAC